MNIRRATLVDAELLCRLNEPVQQLHHEWRPDFFKPHSVTREMIADYQTRLLDENIYIFIAEVEQVPVGYVLAQIHERPDNPYTYPVRSMIVDQLSVNPEHRSKGYGEMLMRHVSELAKSQGIKKVVLTVWVYNQRAVEFYERLGFKARDLHLELNLE